MHKDKVAFHQINKIRTSCEKVTMNTRELSKRVNNSSDLVISCFESFKGEYKAFKKDPKNENPKDMGKLDHQFRCLDSAVCGLKTSIAVARDPRWSRDMH